MTLCPKPFSRKKCPILRSSSSLIIVTSPSSTPNISAAMVQKVSQIEVNLDEGVVLHSPFHDAKPWKLLNPSGPTKFSNMCKDVSWKKRECKPEVAEAAPSISGCQDTVKWKARVEKRPEAASLHSTLLENVRPEPVLTELLRSEAAADMVPTDGSEYHVLAVDDSIIDQKVIERLLKTSCYKVTIVDSALRALEVLGLSESCPTSLKANSIEVNLIITDYCMPEMTGYDLLKRVKAQSSALKEIPVVVMSSENDSSRIERCLAEGAEDFIIKPVQMAHVKQLRGHIRPLSRSGESSSICAKRKVGSAYALQVTTSPERRPRFSGVVVA